MVHAEMRYCKVAHQNGLIFTLSKKCKIFNFTTVINRMDNKCDLNLKVMHQNTYGHLFHVQLLECPAGFLLFDFCYLF